MLCRACTAATALTHCAAVAAQGAAEEKLTHEQEKQVAASLLPNVLPFKLKQTDGRTVRNTKARVACAARASAARCWVRTWGVRPKE